MMKKLSGDPAVAILMDKPTRGDTVDVEAHTLAVSLATEAASLSLSSRASLPGQNTSKLSIMCGRLAANAATDRRG
jgi:hypothetical protein